MLDDEEIEFGKDVTEVVNKVARKTGDIVKGIKAREVTKVEYEDGFREVLKIEYTLYTGKWGFIELVVGRNRNVYINASNYDELEIAQYIEYGKNWGELTEEILTEYHS